MSRKYDHAAELSPQYPADPRCKVCGQPIVGSWTYLGVLRQPYMIWKHKPSWRASR